MFGFRAVAFMAVGLNDDDTRRMIVLVWLALWSGQVGR